MCRRSASVCAIAGFVVASALAQSASADWGNVREVTIGTAQVLEQGAATVGLAAPLSVGLTNDLTLHTHPILDLLLTWNAGVRFRLFERRRWILALAGHGIVSMYKRSDVTRPTPGQVHPGLTFTWYAGDQLALTTTASYAVHFGTALEHGTAAALQVHWLAAPNTLWVAETYARWVVGEAEVATAALDLRWVRALTMFRRAHVMAGITVGERVTATELEWWDLSGWPVRPSVDLWWRF
ncbi:MAG: hypothetical protein EXR79_14095 [Myxococcales bacterium]|nr:hypothetical protein [Myxococcales bacterium]